MVLGRLRSRSNMPDSSRKDLSIQSLRGLALILMVAGHVIGIGPDRGMQVADDSAWRYLYLALEDTGRRLQSRLRSRVSGMGWCPPYRGIGSTPLNGGIIPTTSLDRNGAKTLPLGLFSLMIIA